MFTVRALFLLSSFRHVSWSEGARAICNALSLTLLYKRIKIHELAGSAQRCRHNRSGFSVPPGPKEPVPSSSGPKESARCASPQSMP